LASAAGIFCDASSSGDEEASGIIEVRQALEVEIAAIHDIECAGFRNELIQNIDVMHLAVADEDERRDAAAQIKQCMKLHGGLGIPVTIRRRISPGLAAIDAQAMREAIEELKKEGRIEFLKRYGFSRSSKFYLRYGQRLYDTKALVAAAYRYATGKMLRYTEFSGGAQTQAVFGRLTRQDPIFLRSSKIGLVSCATSRPSMTASRAPGRICVN
jgi:hypothetical protein